MVCAVEVKDSNNEVAVTERLVLAASSIITKPLLLYLSFFSGIITFSCKSSTALCLVLLTLVVVIHIMLVPVLPGALS
jgi:hypothetical protein